jgi:esterase/lipase superfamily enzyme
LPLDLPPAADPTLGAAVEIDERTWWSPALGRDVSLKVYGNAGRPVVAFPSQDGRYWDGLL